MPSTGKYQYVCRACQQWFVTDRPIGHAETKICYVCGAADAWTALTAPVAQDPTQVILTDDDREFLHAMHIASD
jgi:rRNA maturation endonuclease Nob1